MDNIDEAESDHSSDDDFVPKKRKMQESHASTSTKTSSKCDYKSLRCSHCSSEFSTSKIVRRHEKTCKKNPVKVSNFKCAKCTLSFTRKDNLAAHTKKCHDESEADSHTSKILCTFCSTPFSSKYVALRHQRRCSKNPDCEKEKFKCPKCHSLFSQKFNMSAHLRTCDRSDTDQNCLIPCSFCTLNFESKKIAKRHENVCSGNPQSLSCPNCSLSFTRKDKLSNHLTKCEAGVLKKKRIQCLHNDCSVSFMTKTSLIEHLKKVHNSSIDSEVHLSFHSEADFKAWKEKEEARTFSYFSKDCGVKGSRTYFYCQHDGSDRAHRKNNTANRLTSRKTRIGQIKQGNLCISKIVVVSREDGSCEMTYYPSHSHELSKHDLAHHPVSDSTNTFIENLISLNVPVREIKKALQAPTLERDNRDAQGDINKNVLITERQIKQRMARRKNKLRLHKDDATSVYLLTELLQKEKYDPVIIYKPVGMGIVAGPQELLETKLSNDLFMFGFQTEQQRNLMVEGCKKILIVDDTHNVTQYENIRLLNIMVVDHNNRGWAAGHFISNSMASDVLRVFVKALKLRCQMFDETLNINCIITDDDPALINGFRDGLEEEIRHILCQGTT